MNNSTTDGRKAVQIESPPARATTACRAGFLFGGHVMTAPFLVIGRSTRKVLRQCATMQEAVGFSAGCSRPTSVAMLTECWTVAESWYAVKLVNYETGETIIEGPTLELNEAVDLVRCAKLVILPARRPKGVEA